MITVLIIILAYFAVAFPLAVVLGKYLARMDERR